MCYVQGTSEIKKKIQKIKRKRKPMLVNAGHSNRDNEPSPLRRNLSFRLFHFACLSSHTFPFLTRPLLCAAWSRYAMISVSASVFFKRMVSRQVFSSTTACILLDEVIDEWLVSEAKATSHIIKALLQAQLRYGFQEDLGFLVFKVQFRIPRKKTRVDYVS